MLGQLILASPVLDTRFACILRHAKLDRFDALRRDFRKPPSENLMAKSMPLDGFAPKTEDGAPELPVAPRDLVAVSTQ